MTDLDALLREVLHRQADRVAPSTELLSRVHHRSDRLRRRRRVTTGVTILTAVSVSALIVSNLDRPRGPEPIPPAVSPTVSPDRHAAPTSEGRVPTRDVSPSPLPSSGVAPSPAFPSPASPSSGPQATGTAPDDAPTGERPAPAGIPSRNSSRPAGKTELSDPSPTSISAASPTNSAMTDLPDTWSATTSYRP